jgi:deazaflavin-dependent oxidoreductase (nitroreductase family)
LIPVGRTVTAVKKTLTRLGNRIGVWLYRKSDGRIGGGPQVIVITAPGRKSGIPRSTCVRFVESPEGLVVWGTGSGSKSVPDWFLNLRAAGVVSVQTTDGTREMRVRELQDAERDAVWQNLVLAELPGVQRFAEMSGRKIPVAVLT